MVALDQHDESILRLRLRTLSLIILGALFLLVLWLFYIQVIRHSHYDKLAFSTRIQRERIVAPRGLIWARDGTSKLVVNVPVYQISILPGKLHGRDELVSLACEWLIVDEDKLRNKLAEWIEKYPDEREMIVVQAADKEQISVLRENRELFSFFRLVMKHRRQYPEGSLAAHLLGYVGEVMDEEVKRSSELHASDIIGRTGIEYTYEKYLRGVDGVRIVEISADGIPIGEVKGLLEGEDNENAVGSHPPVPGADLILTIDLNLQRAVESAFTWERGSVVVMDPRNGEILAALSRPAYDPNIFIEGVSEERWKELYENPDNPLFNRTVQATYPPGSTFKVITAYAGLKNGLISRYQYMRPCVGAYRFGNRYFHCWKPEGHGALATLGAIVHSCDVYFYQVGELLTANQFASAGRIFGLGRKTGVDLPSEAAGIIPDHAYFDRRFGKGKWTKGHLLNYSIGQGEILTTPIQLCVLTSIFANGGRMVRPHVVERIVDADGGLIYENNAESIPMPVIEQDILRYIREAMERVVSAETGTGRATAVPGIRIAGKTGTVQNPHGKDHAIFVAFAPMEDPEVALAIVMENAGQGGVMAAPVAREILSTYFHFLAGEKGLSRDVVLSPRSDRGSEE